MGPPQFGVGNLVDPFPDFHIVWVFNPTWTQIPVIVFRHAFGYPGGDVDTIRNILDGEIDFRCLGPYLLPHFSADVAVESTHGVVPCG